MRGDGLQEHKLVEVSGGSDERFGGGEFCAAGAGGEAAGEVARLLFCGFPDGQGV